MAHKKFGEDLFDTFDAQEETGQEPTNISVKRKVGRPKTKDVKNKCKNINIAVPLETLDKWNEIKDAAGGNMTAYIVRLIENDLNQNYDKYMQIIDRQKELGIF